MANTEQPDDPIDWNLTTWDGARRETLRRWAELPLEQIIAALEEMQKLSEMLALPSAIGTQNPQRDIGDGHGVHEPHAGYSSATDISDARALPHYTDAEFASLNEQALIACLRAHEDRVPRNLIDACAARGDAMVHALENYIDDPDF